MTRRPPRSTRTDTLFPYTTLFRSFFGGFASIKHGDAMRPIETRAVSMPVFGGWQRPARHRFISDQEDFRVIRQRPAFLELRDQSTPFQAERDIIHWRQIRSDARRVGQECVSLC